MLHFKSGRRWFPRRLLESLEPRRLLSTASSLDTSFGNAGQSTVDFNEPLNSYSSYLAQTSDGHFISAGYATSGGFDHSLIARFTSGGAIDSNYGSSGQAASINAAYQQPVYAADPATGMVIAASSYGAQRFLGTGAADSTWTNLGSSFTNGAAVTAIALRGSGKSLIATTNSLIALNSDGTIDTTWFTSGVYTFASTTVSGSSATQQFSPRALLVQSDGSFVVGGALTTTNGSTVTTQAEIYRFTSAGRKATTNGTQLLPLSTTASAIDAMTVDSNGLMLIAGQNVSSSFVERLNGTTPDSTFGSSGVAQFDLQSSANEDFNNVAVDAQGHIVLSDVRTDGTQPTVKLVRLTSSGTLDTTFNGTGLLSTVPGVNAGKIFIGGFVPQSDGSIIVSFNSQIAGSAILQNATYQTGLLKLTANGSLSPSFGTSNGITQTQAIGGGLIYSYASALQPDGKLLLVGEDYTSGDALVMRMNADGTADTSFGSTGQGVSDNPSVTEATKLILEPSGKILVLGVTRTGTSAMLSLNANGSLDTTFGTNGVVTPPAGSSFNFSTAAVQPDGKIVVATGYNVTAPTLQRYNGNGTLDTTFGTGGTATVPAVQFDEFYSSLGGITVAPTGQIFIYGLDSSQRLFVADLNSAGALNDNFGSGGASIFNGISGATLGLNVESDGSLRVGAAEYTPLTASDYAFELVAINANGSLDTSFGTNGVATLPLSKTTDLGPPNPVDFIDAYTQTANGKYVIVGKHQDESISPVIPSGNFVTEMDADGSLDTTFAPNGIDVYNTSFNELAIGRVFVNADNQIVIGASGYTNSSGSTFAAARLNGEGVAPAVITNPVNVTTAIGGTASFTATASGFPTPTVQWQVSTDGGNTFNNITGNSSARTTTLTISGVTTAENGYEYRALFSSSAGSATTTAATLLLEPLSVQSFTVNDGSAQRSMVRTLTIAFNAPVTLDSGAITLTRTSGNTTAISFTAATTDGGMTYVITPTSGISGGSLTDGNYSLTINSSGVHSAASSQITLSGGNPTFTFFRLFGDGNGDGTVNLSDYRSFTLTYLKSTGGTGYNAAFDSNSDGTINLIDYRAFTVNYLHSITQ